MKIYALLLACLTVSLASQTNAQTAGGAGGGGASGAAAGGAAAGGAAGAGSGALGGSGAGAVGGIGGTGTGVGGVPGGVAPGTGVQPAIPPGRAPIGQPGIPGTPGNPVTPATGALGGVTPGTGALGGTVPGAVTPGAANGTINGTQPGTGTTADVQTGVLGQRSTTAIPVSPADRAFTDQIRAQLVTGNMGTVNGRVTRVPGINQQALSGVQIGANNGVVTLRGNVSSVAEGRLLEQRIRQMTGVRSVVNGLTVGSPRAVPANGALPGTTAPGAATTLPSNPSTPNISR